MLRVRATSTAAEKAGVKQQLVDRQTGLEKTSLRANQRRLEDRKREQHTADLRPIGLGVCPSATHIVFCKLALIHVA